MLSDEVQKYFSDECLNPKPSPAPIGVAEAWRFQGHLLLHLLNDDVVAVPRSEILTGLRRGTTCVWDKDLNQWIWKVCLISCGRACRCLSVFISGVFACVRVRVCVCVSA